MYYKDLEVWKKSIECVKNIYLITNKYPDNEKYGIVSQMRRAAVSIPSNIAEGSARFSDKESARFIDVAIGSVAELETQLIISKELDFINSIDKILEDLKQINVMLLGLKKFYNKQT